MSTVSPRHLIWAVGKVTLAEGSLVWAASHCQEQCLQDILQSAVRCGYADVNSTDSTGRTACSHLAGNGDSDFLELLLTIPGLDPNLPDNEGNTPLHFAAQAGHVEVVSLLLTRCPDIVVDAKNHLGFTPLMKAAIQGRTKCAKLLLFAGACPTMRDLGRGLRAEEWARFCGRYTCADMLASEARSQLLERGSYGSWGSDSDLAGPRIVNGVLQPCIAPASPSLASKIKAAFGRPKAPPTALVQHITSAAFTATTPALPTAALPPVVRSLIRPLTVPKLQVTPDSQPSSPTSSVKIKKKSASFR